MKLKKLRTLDLAFNNLKVLQGALFKLPKLKILNLHGNQIKHLPKQILDSKITTLILSKNKIEHLDESLISGITKLDIVDNPLTSKKEQGNVKIEQNKELVNAPIKKKTIMNKKNKIFISYSHADSAYFDRLITHLKVLKNYNGEFEERRVKNLTALQRELKYLGLWKFAGAVMYVLHEALGLPEAKMIAPIDVYEGRFLLAEIMQEGNFGQYDTRLGSKENEGKLHRYLRMSLRNLRFVKHYPTEALSEPLFRTWFALWKKIHGIR